MRTEKDKHIINQAFDIIEDLLNHLEGYNYKNSPHKDTIDYNKREFNHLKNEFKEKGE